MNTERPMSHWWVVVTYHLRIFLKGTNKQRKLPVPRGVRKHQLSHWRCLRPEGSWEMSSKCSREVVSNLKYSAQACCPSILISYKIFKCSKTCLLCLPFPRKLLRNGVCMKEEAAEEKGRPDIWETRCRSQRTQELEKEGPSAAALDGSSPVLKDWSCRRGISNNWKDEPIASPCLASGDVIFSCLVLQRKKTYPEIDTQKLRR